MHRLPIVFLTGASALCSACFVSMKIKIERSTVANRRHASDFHEATARQFAAIRPSSAKRSLGTMSKAHKQWTLEALELQLPQREQGPDGN